MDTLEAIKARRAVKHYDPEYSISDSEVEELMSLVKLSPTAFNIQNFRFVRVADMELRKSIRAIAWDQAL